MILKKINAIAFAGAAVIILSSQQLLAGTFGSFTYTDNGSSITIDNCTARGNVIIPTTIDGKPVTEIGDRAFHRSGITGVTIPDGVVSIGWYSFNRCGKLTEITLPQSLKTIDAMAFAFCSNLESINIPSSLEYVGDDVFWGSKKLKSAVIAEGATSLPAGTFSLCGALENVVFPSTLTNIGANAFSGCRKLKTVALPEKLQMIGDGAFYGTAITHLVIPETVKKVGPSAFRGCGTLESIVLPGNLAEISDEAFSGCVKLSAPVIPAKVRRIGKNAFANCGFPIISIPGSIRTIDDFAFTGCTRLVSALFNGDAPTLGRKVFDPAPDFIVFIQKGTKGYTAPKWYGHRVSLPRPEITVSSEQEVSLTSGTSNAKFGNVLIGQKSVTKRLIIQNIGNRKLTKIEGKIKGGSSKDFQITMISKSSLAPGKTAFIELAFSPKVKGGSISKLQIKSDDLDESPFEVELRGVGLLGIK